MERQPTQCRRKSLAGKLAAWAPIAFLCLTATPRVAAQSPEFERYSKSILDRVVAGEDVRKVMAEIEASLINDKKAPPACKVTIPPDGFPGVTSQRFYYLSEILPATIGVEDPSCGEWLACFLQKVPGTAHAGATLVIDRQCVSRRSLVVPDRFVLAGVGIDGEGRLVFDLPQSSRALRFKTPADAGDVPVLHSQIRDLSIGNRSCCGQTGIDLSNSTLVNIQNVRVSGFAFGIRGEKAYRHIIQGSNLSDNGIGIWLGFDTTDWQIRENGISNGWLGISFDPGSRGNVVSGGVLESNLLGAILLSGHGNTVQSSWIEGNGTTKGGVAIEVVGATDARILGNRFGSNNIKDLGKKTLRCYNTTSDEILPDNCP